VRALWSTNGINSTSTIAGINSFFTIPDQTTKVLECYYPASIQAGIDTARGGSNCGVEYLIFGRFRLNQALSFTFILQKSQAGLSASIIDPGRSRCLDERFMCSYIPMRRYIKVPVGQMVAWFEGRNCCRRDKAIPFQSDRTIGHFPANPPAQYSVSRRTRQIRRTLDELLGFR
jgi:hypothetical protein